MKRLALTIIVIVVLTETVRAQGIWVPQPFGHQRVRVRPVVVQPVILPRVYGGCHQRVVLPWEYGRGYGRVGYGGYSRIWRSGSRTARAIAIADAALPWVEMIMTDRRIDKDQQHELRVLDRQLGR